MARIFISYRRGDSAGHAGRLYDRLSERFGQARVFMDIDHIGPGVDFVAVIEAAVAKCDVLLALIGEEWLDTTDAEGRRRLDDPEDFVRVEIATALRRNILVIPVLVQGAKMPRALDLPGDLAMLARRNALELSDSRWRFDVGRLIETLEGLDAPPPLERRYAEALADFDAGRWAEAAEGFGAVVAEEAGYRDAAGKLEEARRRGRLLDSYVAGRRAFEAADWARAIACLEEALALDDDHDDAAGMLALAKFQRRLAGLYGEAVERMESRQWAEARQPLAELQRLAPGYRDVEARLAWLERQLAPAPVPVQPPPPSPVPALPVAGARSGQERPRRPRLGLVVAVLAVPLCVLGAIVAGVGVAQSQDTPTVTVAPTAPMRIVPGQPTTAPVVPARPTPTPTAPPRRTATPVPPTRRTIVPNAPARLLVAPTLPTAPHLAAHGACALG